MAQPRERHAWTLRLLAWLRGWGDTEWVEALLAAESVLWGLWLAAPSTPVWVETYPGRAALFRFLLAVAPLWAWGLLAALLGMLRIVSLSLCVQWEFREKQADGAPGRKRFLLAYRLRRWVAGLAALFWSYLTASFAWADWLSPGMPLYGGLALFSAVVYFAMAPLPAGPETEKAEGPPGGDPL